MRGWIPGMPDDQTTGLPPVKIEQKIEEEEPDAIINGQPVTIPWPFGVPTQDDSEA